MDKAVYPIPAHKGFVFVLCAPSGTGKTTLGLRLLKEFPNLVYSVSCTTRPPRQGEIDGVDYHFISQADFIARREQDEFIEWAEVHGNLYGTLRSAVEKTLNSGKDLLFDIDVQGAAQIELNLNASLALAFIVPQSLAKLEARLRNRGTDDDATIARRMANAKGEIKNAHWFNYIIINDDLEQAYDQLRAAYLATALSPRQQFKVLNNLLNEFN